LSNEARGRGRRTRRTRRREQEQQDIAYILTAYNRLSRIYTREGGRKKDRSVTHLRVKLKVQYGKSGSVLVRKADGLRIGLACVLSGPKETRIAQDPNLVGVIFVPPKGFHTRGREGRDLKTTIRKFGGLTTPSFSSILSSPKNAIRSVE
jgi:hypothetical protein